MQTANEEYITFNMDNNTSDITLDISSTHQLFNTLILNDQLRIQEDGKIIVSTELKDSMSELVEEFWKEVTKKFPIQSDAQDRIDHMKEGIKAAIDSCESCDDGSCIACEILKTAMNDQVKPEIQEQHKETDNVGIEVGGISYGYKTAGGPDRYGFAANLDVIEESNNE